MDTATYILEKVAPIFNKQGYVGTSLSDLTEVTGLTKGAIYCNFENKEDLAVKAFELNVKIALLPLFKIIAAQEGSVNKLLAVTSYHRTYYNIVKKLGGCPMLRVGVDTKFNNPLLHKKSQKLSKKFLNGLASILHEGIENKEIQKSTEVDKNAKLILSIIEGSTLLAFTHNNKTIIADAMDFIDTEIIEKIRI